MVGHGKQKNKRSNFEMQRRTMTFVTMRPLRQREKAYLFNKLNIGLSLLVAAQLVLCLVFFLSQNNISVFHSNVASISLPSPAFRNKLFVWGVRLSYVNADEAIFQMLVQGKHHLTNRQIEFTDDKLSATLLRLDPDFPMLKCIHDDQESNMEPQRNLHVERSVRLGTVWFRCKIKLPHAASVLQNHVSITVESIHDGAKHVFNVPTQSDKLGMGGPDNTLTRPIAMLPKVKFMMCVGGIRANGVHLLPEFLRHHLRMGFEHFMLGLQDSAAESKIMNILNKLVSTNVVVTQTFDFKYVSLVRRDLAKLVFYESCLAYAKTKAEFVMNLDLDEYWMPAQLEWTIGDVVKQAHTSNCPSDWCFLSFPTVSTWRRFPSRSTGQITNVANELQWRNAGNGSFVWQKSITKTSRAFTSGFHTFGTCSIDAYTFVLANHESKLECALRVPNLGKVHHFGALFHGTVKSRVTKAQQRDEYSAYAATAQGLSVLVKPVWGNKDFEF